MFRITVKILKWAAPYKTRMILGFILSFINSIFIALPIFLAAQVFNRVLQGVPITMYDILGVLGLMVVLVLARFITAYMKNKLQESIAYEMSAKERLNICLLYTSDAADDLQPV